MSSCSSVRAERAWSGARRRNRWMVPSREPRWIQKLCRRAAARLRGGVCRAARQRRAARRSGSQRKHWLSRQRYLTLSKMRRRRMAWREQKRGAAGPRACAQRGLGVGATAERHLPGRSSGRGLRRLRIRSSAVRRQRWERETGGSMRPGVRRCLLARPAMLTARPLRGLWIALECRWQKPEESTASSMPTRSRQGSERESRWGRRCLEVVLRGVSPARPTRPERWEVWRRAVRAREGAMKMTRQTGPARAHPRMRTIEVWRVEFRLSRARPVATRWR